MDQAKPQLIEKALAFALEAHRGQTDRQGRAYILHPLHLMAQMDTDEERLVAILHDTIEDSDRTLDDIRALGMPEVVVEAVALLTHDKEGEPYMEYVGRLKSNPIARKVKLADLQHNMTISRMSEVKERDVARLNKYLQARAFLMQPD